MSTRLSRLLIAATALLMMSSCQRGPSTVQHEWAEARRLTADARVQFGKAVDASNRAVMAETDEQSAAFARDADKSSAVVDREVGDLGSLLQRLQYPKELETHDRLKKALTAYRTADRSLLDLAVENSNLKAQRLSFGPAREAADRFKAALAPLSAEAKPADRYRIESLIQYAVASVREAQTLHGPHIAAAEDEAMTRLEGQLATLEKQTTDALTELSELVPAGALTAAQAEFEQLKALRGQIVELSRKNTNVRSLDLALRVKPLLTAACDDTLRELQVQLADEGVKATK